MREPRAIPSKREEGERREAVPLAHLFIRKIFEFTQPTELPQATTGGWLVCPAPSSPVTSQCNELAFCGVKMDKGLEKKVTPEQISQRVHSFALLTLGGVILEVSG